MSLAFTNRSTPESQPILTSQSSTHIAWSTALSDNELCRKELCRKDGELTSQLSRLDIEDMTSSLHLSYDAPGQQTTTLKVAKKYKSREISRGHWTLNKRQALQHMQVPFCTLLLRLITSCWNWERWTLRRFTICQLRTEINCINRTTNWWYTFLEKQSRQDLPVSKSATVLEDKDRHAERDSHHSLMRLDKFSNEFSIVYKQM